VEGVFIMAEVDYVMLIALEYMLITGLWVKVGTGHLMVAEEAISVVVEFLVIMMQTMVAEVVLGYQIHMQTHQ
jgi:hypothetical protein